MYLISIEKELKRLERAQDWLERSWERAASDMPITAPRVSRWTLAQHLHHTAHANAALLKALADHNPAKDAPTTGRPNLGGILVLLLRRMPRGRARSPKRYHPPEKPEPDEVSQQIRASRTQLTAVAKDPQRLKNLAGVLKHPVLGFLTPPRWLCVARIHAEHHIRIMRDIETEGLPTSTSKTANP